LAGCSNSRVRESTTAGRARSVVVVALWNLSTQAGRLEVPTDLWPAFVAAVRATKPRQRRRVRVPKDDDGDALP
jgi:hypothetical protein